jgi:uncharacterized protein YndB with AHSA1/START domain
MDHTLRVTRDIFIQTDPLTVWKALTDKEMIRQYFFGTEAVSDWKVGSSLIFQGEWDGQIYRDKGHIRAVEKGKLLQYTYWSEFSGLQDREENYALVTYRLEPKENGTMLTISQKGYAGKEAAAHSGEGWAMVLENLRKLLEQD